MDGNSAKKAPVLDHLVDTSKPSARKPPVSAQQSQPAAQPAVTSMNGSKLAGTAPQARPVQGKQAHTENVPQNRRTDKSEFEIELARTVNKIMLKHFEDASEEIVQQVLSEVRARLPGRRKN